MTQPVAPAGANTWILGTRKGAWSMRRPTGGKQLQLEEPWFFGCQVHHVVQDPRGAGTILAAVRTGHLGPTVYRSRDDGVTWNGVPGFNDGAILAKWCYNFAPGTPDGPKCHSVQVDPVNPKRMILGLSGGGLFLSEDQGGSWRPVNGGVAMDFAPPKE